MDLFSCFSCFRCFARRFWNHTCKDIFPYRSVAQLVFQHVFLLVNSVYFLFHNFTPLSRDPRLPYPLYPSRVLLLPGRSVSIHSSSRLLILALLVCMPGDKLNYAQKPKKGEGEEEESVGETLISLSLALPTSRGERKRDYRTLQA